MAPVNDADPVLNQELVMAGAPELVARLLHCNGRTCDYEWLSGQVMTLTGQPMTRQCIQDLMTGVTDPTLRELSDLLGAMGYRLTLNLARMGLPS